MPISLAKPLHRDRVHPRRKTFERTTVFHGDESAVGHILNVSECGAQMHSAAAVAPGEPIRVLISTREVHATVMWIDGSRFGLRFDYPLSAQEIGGLLR